MQKLFISVSYFLRHLFIGIFNFCIFPPNVRTRVYIFPPNISYFVSWIAHNLSSVLWISWKMHPVNAKKLSYLRAQASILRSTGLSVKEISKKLKKSERWVVKWSSRNDGFEDKKRTGRQKILNEAAKRIVNKAKYKRGNSTRQLSQKLASKGHVGGKNTIWRFMKSEGWRPLRRQKNLCSQPSSVR